MSALITRERLATLSSGEAAALFLIQQDEGAPVEAGLFDEWLAENAENRAAWDAATGAWDLFDDADDPVFAALRESALAVPRTSRMEGLRSRWRPATAAAALLAVVALGLQLGRADLSGGNPFVSTPDSAPVEQLYTATQGEMMNVVLADGTRMTLDANARARVAFATGRRWVVLERGGAEFTVKHDASRPFTVAALDRMIVDFGTRFRVELEPGSLEVALYEGSVQVSDVAGKPPIVLLPGQQLIVRAGEHDVIVPISGEEEAPGELVQFDNVALSAAADTINQGSATKLVITDPQVMKLRISGTFRAGDPDRFARTVSELLSLRVVRTGKFEIELRLKR